MQKPYEFVVRSLLIFFSAITVLGIFGFLPSGLQDRMNSHPLSLFSSSTATADAVAGARVSATSTTPTITASADVPAVQYAPSGTVEYPTSIVIPAIGLNDPILNPNTTDATIFDSDLQEGVVRWPTSGTLSSDQNIFLFGHSSYLAIVHNQAYRSFNGIQNLVEGDEIELKGPQTTSIYKVASVAFTTNTAATVNIAGTARQLILSTCNVLLAKEDRIVVTAEFVGNFPNSVVN